MPLEFVKDKQGVWRVAGAKVRVRDIWWSERNNARMRELRKMYPQFSEGQLREILAFAWERREEMWAESRSGI